MVDLASDRNLPWANLSPATVEILTATLDDGLAPVNPVDLWGTGHEWQRVYRTSVAALLADDAVGALNYGIDFNQGSRLNDDYAAIAIESCQSTSKPFAVVSNVSAGIDPAWASTLRENGVPVLLGTETGLAAFAHLRQWSRRQRQALDWQAVQPAIDSADLEPLDYHDRPLDEWLSSYYLQAPDLLRAMHAHQAKNKKELIERANRIGYPVGLKSLKPGLTHKTEAGGVVLNIPDYRALHQEYEYMSHALGPQVMVCAMYDTSRGTELILGSRIDPQFGPLVSVGMGRHLGRDHARCRDISCAGFSRGGAVPACPICVAIPACWGPAESSRSIWRSWPRRSRTSVRSQVARQHEVASMEINPLLAIGSELTMLDALVIPWGAVSPTPE